MGKREEYLRKKEFLLTDESICSDNRELFKTFLEWEEYKLKRKNKLKLLDEACYKTLCNYPAYFRNVNTWFNNKAWKDLTKEEIKQVYDDLEDGKLIGSNGGIITGKEDYYNKIFKSKPFALAGKKEIAIEVLEYYESNNEREVRFFEEDTYKKIVAATKTEKQRLLCWLAWDFGENIFTLLQLQKKNFTREVDPETNEVYYLLHLPKEKIKRTRTVRTEPTLYHETVELLEVVLPTLNNDDYLFNFGHRNALKFLKEIRSRINAVCTPNGQPVTWKDFRSSMACHLLDLGWTADEIKGRLGHKPSSDVIDHYVNYKALNKKKPKQKVNEGKVKELNAKVGKLNDRDKLNKKRIEELQQQNEARARELEELKEKFDKVSSVATVALGKVDFLIGQIESNHPGITAIAEQRRHQRKQQSDA